MKIQSISDRLPLMLAIALVSAVPVALGQDDAPDYATTLPSAHVTSSQEILAYNRTIKELESREGAYGASLPESMLGLARTLQAQGRHDEAIEVYKRSVHLTRINEGLYCQQQIPLLQGEIDSHKALQNYAQADERQNYLYRVQTHSIGSSTELVAAYMDQAEWQYEAYQLRLGQNDYERLIDMTELYRVAFNDVVTREGEYSPNLLPPLYGMLQAQYLISGYNILPSTPVFDEEGYVDEGLLRFKAYHHKSYKQGNAIIDAISAIEKKNNPSDSAATAQTMVMLGDWRLWNGRTDEALAAYREATTELARADDAQEKAQQLFGEPVALPAIADMHPLPPVVEPNKAAVTLAFGVSEGGRVHDVERLDDNEDSDKQAYRLMRELRNTTFRPRFEAGQPVETQNIVKAFQIQ
ncbi:MAG: tetratricopeptide repeat-containing protein [Halioglobus sp.]|nr:tetratricopeptide repeat-containing protein [Halioglobus sp.]